MPVSTSFLHTATLDRKRLLLILFSWGQDQAAYVAMRTADTPLMHTVIMQSWLTEMTNNGFATKNLRQEWLCCCTLYIVYCVLRIAQSSLCFATGFASLYGLVYMQTAEALSSVLKSNDTLREIDLSGNAFGVEGGRSLREALTDNMYVHRLSAIFACQKKCALLHHG